MSRCLISNRISISGTVLALCVLVPTARAEQDVVVERLTEYGELSVVQARALRSVISKRMARALKSRRASDGVRVAVEQAISGSHGSSSAAELKKRLHAGLDRWALEKLFAPRASSMITCSEKFRLSSGRCESLLAASGEVPLARVAALLSAPSRSAPAGTASMIAARAVEPAAEPEATPRVPREAAAMHVSTVTPGPLDADSAADLDSQPLQMRVPQKTKLPAPMPPAVAHSRAEYDRQREAYWARRRQELDARLAQIRASGGGQHVQRGPASELEREVVGLSPAGAGKASSSAVDGKPAPQSAQLAHKGPSKTESAAETADLIDDLTSDPLGKQAE